MKWACNNSAECCKNNENIGLNDYDVMRFFGKWPSMAVADGDVSIGQTQNHIILSYNLLKEPYIDCSMLKDNLCIVYDRRPIGCRAYPLNINITEDFRKINAHFSYCHGTPALTDADEVLITEEALDNAILRWAWVDTIGEKFLLVMERLNSFVLRKPTSIVELEAKILPKLAKKKQKSFKQMLRHYSELEAKIMISEVVKLIKSRCQKQGEYYRLEINVRVRLVNEQDIILL